MGKLIFTSLLGEMLMMGVATAFAGQSQVSEQEVVPAQLKAQTEGQQITEAITPARTNGPQLLTVEELDKVNAAGLGGLAKFSVKSALMYGCLLTCNTLLGLKNRLTPTPPGPIIIRWAY